MFGNSCIHRKYLLRGIQQPSYSAGNMAINPLSPILISFHQFWVPMYGCSSSLVFTGSLRSTFHFFEKIKQQHSNEILHLYAKLRVFFKKKAAITLFCKCMHYNTDYSRHVGTWQVSYLHIGCLALSIPDMNDHSPHFNNVLMKRPFSANICGKSIILCMRGKYQQNATA